jgi:hypothetical protein
MLILLLLAAGQMAPPAEPLTGKLRGAIWNDLETNGMIGNGNEIAWLWMNFWGYRDDAPMLRMSGLVCRGNATRQHCRFNLLREGGVIQFDGRPVSDRIHCEAPFRRYGAPGEWGIPHLPPRPGGGHSTTTMQCHWDPPS